MDRFESKSLPIIAETTRLYSSRKNVASSIELISSPSTSIVKHAPSFDKRRITLTASSRLGPATYLRLTHPTNQRGILMVMATTIRENHPTMLNAREGDS